MKVTEFLGRKVLDKKAIEIGKVSDLMIEPSKSVITGIQISTGEFGLRRTDLLISPAEIQEIGDYVLLNVEKAEIKGVNEESSAEKEQETSTLKF